MKKSSTSEYVHRLNTALSVYRKTSSSTEVIDILTDQFNVSKRQAYRYLHVALKVEREQKIPEQKMVFTVKLPKSQVKKLRKYAKKADIQLSTLVESIPDVFNLEGVLAYQEVLERLQRCNNYLIEALETSFPHTSEPAVSIELDKGPVGMSTFSREDTQVSDFHQYTSLEFRTGHKNGL